MGKNSKMCKECTLSIYGRWYPKVFDPIKTFIIPLDENFNNCKLQSLFS